MRLLLLKITDSLQRYYVINNAVYKLNNMSIYGNSPLSFKMLKI